MRQLAEEGRTLAMVLHDLPIACRYADHLVAMREGSIIAAGRPSEIVTRELVRELYGVDFTLMHDPENGAPMLTGMRRIRQLGTSLIATQDSPVCATGLPDASDGVRT